MHVPLRLLQLLLPLFSQQSLLPLLFGGLLAASLDVSLPLHLQSVVALFVSHCWEDLYLQQVPFLLSAAAAAAWPLHCTFACARGV